MMSNSDDISVGLGEQRLWSFYDGLRLRFLRSIGDLEGERRWPQVLLLAPDLFVLMVRLVFDHRVPRASRQLIGAALVYFLLPADLLPEIVIGVGGFIDDVVVAAAVLGHVFSPQVTPLAERHWNGSQDLQRLLTETVATARSLLGDNLHDRLVRMLRRRGIDLP